MEYRPVPESRLREFEAVAHYAFSPTDGPGDSDRVDDPSVQLGDPRALFEGDDLSIVCRLLELDARCREDWITLGGLRSVATPPEYRREGRATTLIRRALSEFADRDVPLVALWPFEHDFYAYLGWATAATQATYRLPPSALGPLAANETGRLFRPSADEWERLHSVNLADGEGTSLSLRRSEHWWRHRVFERSGTKRHVYAWERDGDVESYVVYTVDADDGDGGRVLRVYDAAAVDDRAFRHLCGLLYDHDSQVETIELTGDPVGKPGDLLDRVSTPEDVSCELEHGAMVRIADVPTALTAISYPDEFDATVVFDVDDDLAAWNDDVFVASFEDGRGRCVRASDVDDDVTPDVTVGVGTLSQLVVGYRDVGEAVRIGSLTVGDDETAAILDRAFPSRPVALTEFF